MSALVHPAVADDPVAAVLEAHERGALLRLATSGTTGAGRAVVRTTASWWDSFAAYSRLTGVEAGARVWVPGPLTATMNLFAAVHAAVVGARVVGVPSEATHAVLTPMQLDRSSNSLRAGTRVCVAGARLPESQARPGVVHYYGAAELSFVAAGGHADDLRPFAGVEVEVRDRVIWARSPYLAEGQRDADGWATVGDRGAWDGERLVVLGRPGTVTTAGATVSTADVEAQLSRVAAGPIAVYGQPHAGAGELVAVAVVREDDVATLRAYAREHLAPAERPRHWQVVAELPTTGAGKVDTSALARPARG